MESFERNQLHIRGNEILRRGVRVGSIRENHILNHEGKVLGYVEGNHIFGADTKKRAWLEGRDVNLMNEKKLKLDDGHGHSHVEGGELSDAHRAAIQMFLGDEKAEPDHNYGHVMDRGVLNKPQATVRAPLEEEEKTRE